MQRRGGCEDGGAPSPAAAEAEAVGAHGGEAGPTPLPGGVHGHMGDEEAESARSRGGPQPAGQSS